jgi:hypothetical protein
MKNYETTIRVYNQGDDPYDAGEKAGNIFDVSRMEDGMYFSCEPTVHAGGMYLTVFNITSEGHDPFDAGERAGDIIDGSKVDSSMYLSCDPTRPAGCEKMDTDRSYRVFSGEQVLVHA